jgi:predicted membrane channel-forming protein YqfA (hemolysin III family)
MQHDAESMPVIFLVIIGWLYVALMAAVAEATSPAGSVVGAIFTFVLYGAGPVALVAYILATPARKRAIRAREQAEQVAPAAGSAAPDGSGEAAAGAVPPVREEP